MVQVNGKFVGEIKGCVDGTYKAYVVTQTTDYGYMMLPIEGAFATYDSAFKHLEYIALHS